VSYGVFSLDAFHIDYSCIFLCLKKVMINAVPEMKTNICFCFGRRCSVVGPGYYLSLWPPTLSLPAPDLDFSLAKCLLQQQAHPVHNFLGFDKKD
jgi:hypothetical protein